MPTPASHNGSDAARTDTGEADASNSTSLIRRGREVSVMDCRRRMRMAKIVPEDGAAGLWTGNSRFVAAVGRESSMAGANLFLSCPDEEQR